MSRRGGQLAAATVLAVLAVFLVLGTVLLGAYEAHRLGRDWVTPPAPGPPAASSPAPAHVLTDTRQETRWQGTARST